ncbi:MAG: chorismate synthase [Deltaproteobacteria bacterium]|nr:chorismate synthase [Deltaproteobacteria bacterium]
MSGNSFGNVFKFTTWGESHGKAVGVVIDGCPAGLPLDETYIQRDLDRRAPGSSAYTSPRGEPDRAVICSGVFEGVTTGSPISIVVENADADSGKYADIARLMRPGHANYTYLRKYGVFDYRGGGRASARETIGRVAAGAVSRKLLEGQGVSVRAFLSAVGTACAELAPAAASVSALWEKETAFAAKSRIFAPDALAEADFMRQMDEAAALQDSVGGMVSFAANGLPAGLGDPVYAKLPALLAFAMLSIPGSKGVEFGEGFAAASGRGSAVNDAFVNRQGKVMPESNRAGGMLGGISTGLPVYGRVAFKPTSSIFRPQRTVDMDGKEAEFKLPEGSRHDPCIAVRAVPVVEAMCLVVLADALLMNRSARI